MLGLHLGMTLGNPVLGGGAASPVTILGSSLIAWWTADRADLITLNGSAVTSWKDVKAGYDAVQGVSAARPVYSVTGFNGAPGVAYDGTDDELTCTDAALLAALPDGAEPGELWAIVQQDALVANTTERYAVAYGSSAALARRVGRAVPGGVNRGRGVVGDGAAAVTVTNTTADLSSRHLLRVSVGPTSSSVFVDASVATTVSVVPATATVSRIRLGATGNGAVANFWHGQLRDIIATGPLSADQVTALNAWALPRRML